MAEKRACQSGSASTQCSTDTGVHATGQVIGVDLEKAWPAKTVMNALNAHLVGEEVHLVFEARSFLHRQVRSMTGTLVEVGLGRWPVEAMAAALEARDRAACGPVAPSDGLYLTGVGYD